MKNKPKGSLPSHQYCFLEKKPQWKILNSTKTKKSCGRQRFDVQLRPSGTKRVHLNAPRVQAYLKSGDQLHPSNPSVVGVYSIVTDFDLFGSQENKLIFFFIDDLTHLQYFLF